MADHKGGFPHSEITGSKGASASPVLIAACHVLHRLSTPRHPSEALQRLIVSQQNSCMTCSRDWKDAASVMPDFCQTMSSLEPDLEAPGGPVTFFLHYVNRRRSGDRDETCLRSGAGGARRDRTDDLMLAKHALYQLSYGPIGALRRAVGDLSQPFAGLVGPGRLELPTLRLSGVRSNHLSYGPMAARQPG